jgi:hypothetical protein
MSKRSLAVVLLFLGSSQAASALDQRCGSVLDWLLCVNPALSYSDTSTQPPSPSELAGSQANSDNPTARQPSAPRDPRVPASQGQPRAPLSLDYRVINHASRTRTNPRTISQSTKGPQALSKDKKEELYRAFLVWHRRQVINEMRDQSPTK